MPQRTQVYEVTAPDGTVLEVTGPAGASNDEVIRQAQKLYKPKTNPNADILAQQAAKFPTMAEQGRTPGTPVPPKLGMADKALNFVAEEGPVMAGAAIGGALGTTLGPAGMVGGAALGGAAGEFLKQGTRKAVGGGPVAQSLPELGGKVNQAMLTGAMQQAGGALAAKMPGVAANALTNSPVGSIRQMQRVLSPTTKENKYLSAKIAPELVKRGTIALTRGSLANKAGTAKMKAGNALEQAWAALPPGSKMQTAPILNAIDKAKQEFIAGGVDVLPTATAKLDELSGVIKAFGADVSPETLRKTRQVWDMIVDQAGGFGGKDLASTSQVFAQKQAANAIRKEIGKAFPDIKKLNSEFSFWSNVDDVLQDALTRDMNKSLTMTDLVTGSGGATVAAMTGQPLAALAPLITRALQSTGWRTTSAAVKHRIASTIERGDFKAATEMLGKIGGATSAGATRE